MRKLLNNSKNNSNYNFYDIKIIYDLYSPGKINEMVKQYKNLVLSIASNYHYSNVPREDLIAEGLIGLITAIKKFNTNFNVKFHTYAFYWIKARILRFIDIFKREKSHNMKYYDNQNITIHNAHDEYFNNFHRSREIMVEDEILLHEYEREINIAVSLLSPKLRLVFKERFMNTEPKSLQTLANELNLSVESIRNLEKKSIKEVKKNIEYIYYNFKGLLIISPITYIFNKFKNYFLFWW